MRCRQQRGHHLLAPEELANLVPEVGLGAAELQEPFREEDVAAGALLGHELGREQLGQVERSDVCPLLPIVSTKLVARVGVERLTLGRARTTTSRRHRVRLRAGSRARRRGPGRRARRSIAAVERELVRGLGQRRPAWTIDLVVKRLVHQALGGRARSDHVRSIGPDLATIGYNAGLRNTSATQSSRSSRRSNVEANLVERVANRLLLDVDDAAEDEGASRADCLRQAGCELDQDAGDDVGDDQIIFALKRLSVADAALFDTDDGADAVALRVLPRGAHRDRFDIDAIDRARAEEGSRGGQDAGADADVEDAVAWAAARLRGRSWRAGLRDADRCRMPCRDRARRRSRLEPGRYSCQGAFTSTRRPTRWTL